MYKLNVKLNPLKIKLKPAFVSGYNDILLIPQGATNILIEEIKPSSNYLGKYPHEKI